MKPASETSTLPETFAVTPVTAPQPARTPSRANDFYELTKPRLNFLVLITTMVGYYMGVKTSGDWRLVIHTLLGTALTAAGASVLNQVIERKFDRLMPRTQSRPLPGGRITPGEAITYGVVLGIGGVVYLAWAVNILTAIIGAITLLSYLFVYTPMKRLTTLNTVVGAIGGALPPVMGWTAVRNNVGPDAAVLFCILFFWQMPHFLAIAILYRRDYAAGGFKMLPVVDRDLFVTGRQIVLYNAALIPVTLMPTLFHMTGIVYFVAAFVLGLGYLSFGLICATTRERVDARKLFFASIIYLPALLAVMTLDKL
jgi:protoheme IX farnesyltransferase